MSLEDKIKKIIVEQIDGGSTKLLDSLLNIVNERVIIKSLDDETAKKILKDIKLYVTLEFHGDNLSEGYSLSEAFAEVVMMGDTNFEGSHCHLKQLYVVNPTGVSNGEFTYSLEGVEPTKEVEFDEDGNVMSMEQDLQPRAVSDY